MHYSSDVLQIEALFQLQVNLENSKLHVERVISPNNSKWSPFESKIITHEMTKNVDDFSSLWLENFRHFSDRVTGAWRHQTMTSQISMHIALCKYHYNIRKW